MGKMMTKKLLGLAAGIALANGVLVGCGSSSGHEAEAVGLGAETALSPRTGSVVVDGCVLDAWSRATLAGAGAKRVLRGGDVIMLCLVPREDGTVGPRDPSARTALSALAKDLTQEGYRVHFGITFTDESGQRYDGMQTRAFLESAAWRERLKETLPLVIEPADGVEIDLQSLPSDARPFVTGLIADLAQVVRPARRLNVFVPPSVTTPSDLPGGDAFSRTALAPHVDRMRIMTLDYSERDPGPTIDPGWAVDAVRLAKNDFANVDLAYPLYGADFGPRGRRSVIYHEGIALSTIAGVPIERGPTGAPFIRYVAFGGELHQLWFDDAESTGRALGAWSSDVLPLDVGVVFYGLGAEDPTLFERIGGRMF
jgi:hypothetical protein